MRRLFVFALGGPAIGNLALVVLFFIRQAPVHYQLPGDETAVVYGGILGLGLLAGVFGGFLLALPFAYVLGIFPALLVAGVDELMAENDVADGARAAWCAVAGFLAGLTLIVTFFPKDSFSFRHLVLGSTGALAGAICCWYARRQTADAE